MGLKVSFQVALQIMLTVANGDKLILSYFRASMSQESGQIV